MISTRFLAAASGQFHTAGDDVLKYCQDCGKRCKKHKQKEQASPESAKRNMVKNIRQGDKNQAWSGSLVNMERKACRKNDKSGGDSNKRIQNGNIYRFTKQRAFLKLPSRRFQGLT